MDQMAMDQLDHNMGHPRPAITHVARGHHRHSQAARRWRGDLPESVGLEVIDLFLRQDKLGSKGSCLYRVS